MNEASENTSNAGFSIRAIRILAALAISLSMIVPATCLALDSATVIFLVRHAEKESGRNPPLSPAGEQRAEQLAQLLKDARIQQVHSTDYIRTRDTAAPLADRLGLGVVLYDPRKLDDLATQLKHPGGRHLVVGHSNTTPELVELLGGDGGTEIDEPGEYDRLYIITRDSGRVSTTLLRYGTPFVSP